MRRWWLLLGAAVVCLVACSGDQSSSEALGVTTQKLTASQQRILGFESVGAGSTDWSASSGTLSQSTRLVEGVGSLAIASSGNTTITSAALSSLGAVADKITLDLLLPANQPNPSWMGTVKVVVECPSQQLWSEGLAEYQLQGRSTEQFLRFEFPLSASTRSKLSTGTYTDLRFKILLNVASGPGPWLFDRLWVGDAGSGGSGGSGGAGGNTGASLGGQSGSGGTSSVGDPSLGFEDPADWTTSAGVLASSDTRIEGQHSVQVSNITYAEITSKPLSTLGAIGPVVGFDVSVPNPVGDIWWWGTAAISIDCPSRGIHGRWLGQQQLDGSTLDHFRRVEVVLPDNVKSALTSGSYTDLRVKVILTVPQGSGPYLLDRFTFAQQLPEPTPPGPSEALITAIGFETLEAWKTSTGTVALSSNALEGNSSLALSNFTYAEVTSQRFSSLGAQIESPLTVNVWVPTPPGEWAGTIGLSVDLPSKGINWQWIGQHDLGSLTPNTWHRLSFDLPQATILSLRGSYGDLRFKLLMNRPEQLNAFLIDELNLGKLKPLPAAVVEDYVLPLPKGMTFTNVAVGQALVKRFRLADALFPSSGGPVTVLTPFVQTANVVAPRMGRNGGDAIVTVGPWVGDVSAFLDVLGGPISGTAKAGRDVAASATTTFSSANLESFEAGRIHVAYPADLDSRQDVQAFSTGDGFTDELPPGDYGFVTVSPRTGGTFVLRSGVYRMRGLHIGGETPFIRADNSQGPIIIHVRDSLALFSGTWARTASDKHNVLLTYSGRKLGPVLGFDGTLIAPRIEKLTTGRDPFGQGSLGGSVFVRAAELADDRPIQFHPFERDDCAAQPSNGCGVFGCNTSDVDADGLYDCEEQQNHWADPQIFNGVHVRAAGACTSTGTEICSAIDTIQEVEACHAAGPPVLEQNMYSGWSLGGRALQGIGCQDEMHFWPPWAKCTTETTTSFDYQGFIQLAESGTHCFSAPATAGACGSLFFNGATEGVTSATGQQCFEAAAGIYLVRWFIDAPQATLLDTVKVAYCFGGDEDCAATETIPQRMLRPTDSSAHCFNAATDGDEWATDCGPSCENKNCRAPINECDTDADCGPGTFCTDDALNALGMSVVGSKICWNEICRSGVVECGGPDKTCGRCLCRPTCANKECGDDLFDGCNEFCAPACGSGEAGCRSDAECPLDNVCLPDAGASYGLDADADVCVPEHCLERHCDTPDESCGTVCKPEVASCQDMQCGTDPQTDADCGTCPGGTTCSFNECIEPNGGTRVLSRGPSYEVGATPGTHSVGPHGGSTYRIPLRLPPAARGLMPDLELVFSDSSHLRGLLGPGWTLAGASRIHRCNTPTKQKFLSIRAQEPLSNELCLDGRHMRFNEYLTSQFDQPDATVFKLYDDDLSRIVRKGGGSTSFQVDKPDGTTYFYGARSAERRSVRPSEPVDSFDPDDRTPTESWHLSEIRDRFGNTTRFNYTGERRGAEPFGVESSFYLTHIDYSGHKTGATGSNTYKRRIAFQYKAKDDALGRTGGYFHLTAVDDNRVLESVTVDTFDGAESHAGDRIYRIAYEPMPGNGIQRVSSVQECTAYEEDEQCLPPTTFKYDDDANGSTHRFGEPLQGVIDAPEGSINFIREGGNVLNQALPLDADGDGFKDLLQVDQELEVMHFYRAEPQEDGTVSFGSGVAIVGPKASCVSGASIVDLDGDGRDEILDSCPVTRQKQQVNYFHIEADDTVTETQGGVKALASAYVGDIDGNGRPDIIQETGSHIYFADFTNYDLDDGSMRFTLNNRVDAKGMASALSRKRHTREPLMIDVDGDGAHNLMRFDPASKQFFALRLAGDAELTQQERSAIVVDSANEPGGVAIFMNRIARWMPTGLSYQVSPLTGGPAHFDSIRVLDVNGDGLDDVWVQSATLLAPLDPNLFRVPDLLTGNEPNFATEIGNINRIVGQFFAGGIVAAGPTHLWINVGGAFKLKGAMISTLDGHEPTQQECDVRSSDGHCVSRIHSDDFRRSTVLDYDNDGRDELLVQLGEWYRISLDSENEQRGYFAVERLGDLPNGGSRYHKAIDSNPYNTEFQSLAVFSDFNGDANVDILVAGHDATPNNRIMVMGTGRGRGTRLTNVTDGLGNTVDIFHSQDPAVVVTSGDCGEPQLSNRPTCLRSAPVVVSQVSRGTVGGHDYGRTTFTYAHPATADFLRGYYFNARTITEQGSLSDGERPTVTEIHEEFGQALDNGQFEQKLTYPFLFTPTLREVRLSAEVDLEGVARARTVIEENFYENLILPDDKPHLAARTRTIFDDTATEEKAQVLRHHEVFTPDLEGFPLKHEQTYAGADDEEIAYSKVYTDREYDRDRWILGNVEILEVTSARNGVSKTKRVTFDDYDDETGFLKRKTENAGDADRELITEYTPDEFGNVAELKQTSPDGERVSKFDYGLGGIFPRSVTNAAGHVREFEFDDVWGKPTLIEDANDYQIVRRYDGFGRLVHSESRNGNDVSLLAEVAYSYVEPDEIDGVDIPAVFRKSVSSDLFSGRMSDDYDSRGLSVRSKAPGIAMGGSEPYVFTERAYDWAGRQLLVSDAHMEDEAPIWMSFEYDLRGRPTSTKVPTGDKHFRYASAAQFRDRFPFWAAPDAVELTHTVDGEGKESIAIGDHHGDVVVTADGVRLDDGFPGLISRTIRGAMDLPVTLLDPELNETTTEYDNDGLISWTDDENRGRTRFLYDAYGNVKRMIAADEVESVFGYDGINRITSRLDDDQDLTEWSYDVDELGQAKRGRLTEMVAQATGMRTVFGYEDTPRMLGTSVTRHVGGESFTTTTAFDRLGIPTRLGYPSVPRAGGPDFEFAVRPVFDEHSGQMVAVESDDETTDYWRITDTDQRGRVTEVTLGNQLRESYAFDPTSQLLSSLSVVDQADHELSGLGYTYYGNGQIKTRSLAAAGVTRSRTITYDDAHRVHTISESGAAALNEVFSFSPSGRLESRSKFGEYTYDDERPHALGAVAGNEFLYDARGNQGTRTGPNVAGGTQTLSYNRLNLPLQVLFGDPENPDRTVNFEYDALGRRIAKREANGGPEVLSIGDEYERTTGGDAEPSVKHKFRIFAAGREVAQLVYDADTDSSDIQYLHRDQQMSVLFTTNGNGEAGELRDFDVFGESVATPAPTWTTATTESFTGHRRDADIGLVDAGARLYDATFGVFVSADPLRVSGLGSQGLNPYAYANNDPVNLLDPTGLQAQEPETTVYVYGCRSDPSGPGCGPNSDYAGSSGPIQEFFAQPPPPSPSPVQSPQYDQDLWELTSRIGSRGADGQCTGAATCHSPGPYVPWSPLTPPAVAEFLLDGLISTAVAPTPTTPIYRRVSSWRYAIAVASIASVAKGRFPTKAAAAAGGAVGQIDDAASAATTVGRRGQQVNFPNPNAPIPRNAPGTVGGREFSGHAFDRMQERGFVPSVIENAIQHGAATPGSAAGTLRHFDPMNKFNVITDATTGRVITVF
jgi:RHS repeat-associated protein